jgi:hypothetical protein
MGRNAALTRESFKLFRETHVETAAVLRNKEHSVTGSLPRAFVSS